MTDRTINISIEDVISDMQLSKEDKEELYTSFIFAQCEMLPSNYTIIWENNRIKGIKPKEAMKHVSLTITIDKDGSTI